MTHNIHLRGRILQRAAKIHLESIRLFHIWRQGRSDGDLSRYIKTLRRLEVLKQAERSLA